MKDTVPHFIIAVVVSVACILRANGQPAGDPIRHYVDKLNSGKTEEVKQQLPQLVSKYQNDPGILYLQGRLATDGVEAMKFYQSILDNFPKSEWADDALSRIYQYYYALGLYRTAELKMQQLKEQYPNSPYLAEVLKNPVPKKDEVAVSLYTKEAATPAAEPPEAKRETTSVNIKNPQPKVVETVQPYTLQVGAFSSAANAEKQKNFFEDLGFAVEITNKVRSGRSLYLVWVGSFKTPDEAKQTGRQVRAKYKIESIVVQRY